MSERTIKKEKFEEVRKKLLEEIDSLKISIQDKEYIKIVMNQLITSEINNDEGVFVLKNSTDYPVISEEIRLDEKSFQEDKIKLKVIRTINNDNGMPINNCNVKTLEEMLPSIDWKKVQIDTSALESNTLDKLEEFIDKFLEEKKQEHKDNSAIQDKLAHIERVTKLTELLCPDDRLAKIAAKYHDIGRFPQVEILGSFNDGKILHHYLGEDLIARALYRGELEPSKELDSIRQTVSYHARLKFLPYQSEIPEEVVEMIDAVGRADDIENGCIGAVGYVEREAQTDAKGYIKDNPDADQLKVSEEVWGFFQKGEKFDKMKYCKTYADYTLFASVLAITALRGKDRTLAIKALELPCKGSELEGQERQTYSSALEGYKDIFSRLVESEKSQEAYKILEGFYNDKNFEYKKTEGLGENDGDDELSL